MASGGNGEMGRTKRGTSPGVPDGGSGNRFVECVADLIDGSEKTQRQIAAEMDYPNPNIISMFKQGITRVPLDKVPALALAVAADKVDLVRLWLETYEPEMKQVLDEVLGIPLSANERGWIAGLREAFEHGVPEFDEDARAMIRVLAMHKSVAARGRR